MEPKLKEQVKVEFDSKANEYTESILQGKEEQKQEALDLLETGHREIYDRDMFDSDDAVFHGYLGGGIFQKMTGKWTPDPLVEGKYLIIYADLTRPRNQIEQELEKIVEEFWSAERHQTILDVHQLNKQPRKKEQRQKYKLAYRIYDYCTDEKNPLSFEEIAAKVNRKSKTVKELFMWIANLVHPDGIPRYFSKPLPCENCTNKTCEATREMCEKVNEILSEGEVKSGGVLPPINIKNNEDSDASDPFTLITDHNQFKEWGIDKNNEEAEDESY